MKKYIMNSLGHISEIDDKPLTACELADDLEKLYWLEGDGSVCPFQAQATMLRQQADRIAELEKQTELLQAKLNYMFEQELKSARVNR